jgi:hypothetical protein
MNIIIRNLLIVIGVFLLFAWLQYREDIETKKKTSNLFDKYKKPLLFASIIGLILHLNLSNCTNIFIERESIAEPTITIIPIPQNTINNEQDFYTNIAKF